MSQMLYTGIAIAVIGLALWYYGMTQAKSTSPSSAKTGKSIKMLGMLALIAGLGLAGYTYWEENSHHMSGKGSAMYYF
jgi:hypothetical protein